MEEVVGQNPRFMQDPQSDSGAVAEMHQAIREGRATVVEVINVRKMAPGSGTRSAPSACRAAVRAM